MRHQRCAPALALFLAACGGGGGGDDDPAPPPPVAAPTPAPTPAPPPAPIAQAPIAVPAPITPPVDPDPPPPPPPPQAGSPPPPPPPAAPPQPAEGTFILGATVKTALNLQISQDFQAEEIDPATGQPKPDGLRVFVNYFSGNRSYGQTSYATNDPQGQFASAKYPYGSTHFPVVFSDDGVFSLSRSILAFSYDGGQAIERVLVRRNGDFEIKDDFKFIIDTTAAEWRGVEANPGDFIQFQIASYSRSNTVFMLCQHQSFGAVRRRACTLHNKDTGALRGVQVIDDSRNIGQIEYLPAQ